MFVKAGAAGAGPGSGALTAGCLCRAIGRRDRQACKHWETSPGESTGSNAEEGEHGFTCPTASASAAFKALGMAGGRGWQAASHRPARLSVVLRLDLTQEEFQHHTHVRTFPLQRDAAP